MRDKLNNLVLFDKATYEKLNKEVPNYKLITPAVVSERLKIRGSLARAALQELLSKGKTLIPTLIPNQCSSGNLVKLGSSWVARSDFNVRKVCIAVTELAFQHLALFWSHNIRSADSIACQNRQAPFCMDSFLVHWIPSWFT